MFYVHSFLVYLVKIFFDSASFISFHFIYHEYSLNYIRMSVVEFIKTNVFLSILYREISPYVVQSIQSML